MRCIALGEELQRRSWDVRFAADTASLPWASEQLGSRGMTVLEPAAYDDVEGFVAQVAAEAPDVVVIDSYLRPRAAYEGVWRDPSPAGVGRRPQVLALVDGDPDGRAADIYLDQNIGAESDRWPLPPGSTRLAGLDHALIRDDILTLRPPAPKTTTARPPKVLCFFGGTDAMGAAPALAEALVATGAAFRATVVAATPELAADVRAVRPGPEQAVDVIGPTDDLAGRVAAADLVVAAGGTSVWELCCLGAAAAIVRVADNQAESYERAVGLGVVAGLGTLNELRADPDGAADVLSRLLADPAARAALRRAAWSLVDGRGRERVVDAVSDRLAAAGS